MGVELPRLSRLLEEKIFSVVVQRQTRRLQTVMVSWACLG